MKNGEDVVLTPGGVGELFDLCLHRRGSDQIVHDRRRGRRRNDRNWIILSLRSVPGWRCIKWSLDGDVLNEV